MNELTKDLWASVYTESTTIAIEQPRGRRIPSTSDLWFGLSEELDDDVRIELNFDGVLWRVTFKNITFTDDELQRLTVRAFARLLREVE